MSPIARPRAAGFTLIELVVTMVVLVIISMAALPAFRDFFERYRLRGAVDDVTNVIASARAAAVKADRDVNVSFGGTTTDWCVGAAAAEEPDGGALVGAPEACNCVSNAPACLAGGETLRVAPGQHEGVTISATDASFSFDSKLGVIQPLGTACAVFTSPYGNYNMQITVNALGQTTTCSTGERMAGVQMCADLNVEDCP